MIKISCDCGAISYLPTKPSEHDDVLNRLESSARLRDKLAALGVGVPDVQKLVDAFLAWPLPDSVRSDQCVCIPGYRHRSGTNLLSADEAWQMFEHVLKALQTK